MANKDALLRATFYLLLVVYLQTVTFDFVYDDHAAILLNRWLDSWSGLKHIFTGDLWGFSDAYIPVCHYRPLYLAWLWSVRHLFSAAPGWFHLCALLTHVAAVYLAFLVARELLKHDVPAACAAAFFALHPTKVETVAWITAATEPLQAVFVFGALLAFLRTRETQHRRALGAVICFVLALAALLVKETAVVLPVIIFALEWLLSGDGGQHRLLAAVKAAAPSAAAAGVFFCVRWVVLQGFGESVVPPKINEVVFTAPAAFWLYVRQTLWPVHLSILYPVVDIQNFSTVGVLLPALGFLVLAILYWRWARRSPVLTFAVIWFLVTLIPVVGEFRWIQLHDRHLYLPTFGVGLMFAVALGQIRWKGQVISQQATIGLCLAVIITMAAIGGREARVWDSDLSVFTRAVEVAPVNPEAIEVLAEAQFTGGQTSAAFATLRHGLAVLPDSDRLTYSLGTYYYETGQYEQARAPLERVVVMRTETARRATALFLLSNIELQQQNFAEAERRLRAAIELTPSVAGYQRALEQLHRAQAMQASPAQRSAPTMN